MGIYVYGLRGPAQTIRIKVNGVEVEAAVLDFAFKPTADRYYGGESAWEKRQNQKLAHVEQVWNRHGRTPDYAVISDHKRRITVGCTVLEWNTGHGASGTTTSTVDEPNWGGRKIAGELGADNHVVPIRPWKPLA